jgi:hypothetical protein
MPTRVRSVKDECLSKIIPFGERSLRRAMNDYIAHYHTERNHQGKNNLLLFHRNQQNRPRQAGAMSPPVGRTFAVLSPRGSVNCPSGCRTLRHIHTGSLLENSAHILSTPVPIASTSLSSIATMHRIISWIRSRRGWRRAVSQAISKLYR